MRNYKSESVASIQRRSLFSDLLETSIYVLSASCVPPPLKLLRSWNIEKQKQNRKEENKNTNYLFIIDL